MNWNVVLIKACIGLLQLARLVGVLGFFLILGLTLLGNWEENLTFQVHNDFPVEKVDYIKVKSEYKEVLNSPVLVSSSYKFNIGFEKSYRVGFVISFIIVMAGYLYFLTALLRIVQSALGNNFFSGANVKRMRSIGVLLIGLGLVQIVYKWVSTSVFDLFFEFDIPNSSGVRVDLFPNILGNTIFVGLIVLVIAQAFDYGLKLKEEQELTI